MKRAAVLLFALLVACTGVRVRDEVLPPAMAQAFVSIEQEVARGVQAQNPPLDPLVVANIEADVAAIREALALGNRAELLTIDWSALRVLAEAGIMARAQAGEIPLGGAQSKLERLRLFTDAWSAAVSR